MREDDGVEDDCFAGNLDIAAEDSEGGIEPTVGLEEGLIFEFGEGHVGVGADRGALDAGPLADNAVPSDDTVHYATVVL